MATAYDFIIKQGDTLPIFTATVLDENGDVVDLTGASVQLVIRNLSSSSPAVNAAVEITDPSAGEIEYAWESPDTAVADLYMGSLVVSPESGGQFTYPNDGYLSIAIEANLTSTSGPQQLVSVADAKDVLNMPASDRANDAKILRWIRAARPIIEQLAGPIIPQQWEEWYDGGSTFIQLNHRPSVGMGTSPLLTVQAISEYNGPIEWPLAVVASPDQGQLYSAMVDVRRGRVVRRTAGGGVQGFPDTLQSVHIWYSAGQQVVPDNVYEATLEMLRVNYQRTAESPGLSTSVSIDPDDNTPTGSFVGFFVPGRTRELLQPNRRFPSLA
jgi:hypothetical protein